MAILYRELTTLGLYHFVIAIYSDDLGMAS